VSFCKMKILRPSLFFYSSTHVIEVELKHRRDDLINFRVHAGMFSASYYLLRLLRYDKSYYKNEILMTAYNNSNLIALLLIINTPRATIADLMTSEASISYAV